MVKHQAVFLFIGLFIFEGAFQYLLFLNRSMNELVKSGVNIPQFIVISNLLLYLMISMIYSFFLAVVVTFSVHAVITKIKIPWFKTLKDVAWPLTVESMRALGKVLLWSFLIIPGLQWYVRYFLVPLVVLLEPEFKKGKIDALKLSEFLTQGFAWKVAGFILMTMLVSTLRFQDIFNIGTNPIAVILLYLAWATVQLYASLMCYFLYQYLYEIKKDSIQKYLEGA